MTDLIVDGQNALTSPSNTTMRSGAAGWLDEHGHADDDANRLQPFRPAIMTVRWATTVVSIVLAATAMSSGDLNVIGWVTVALGNTVFRTLRPLRDDGSVRTMLLLLAEIALHVLAVIATGYWASPLVLLLINAVIIAGFARGFAFALRVGVASTLAVSVPELSHPDYGRDQLAQSAQWATLLLLGGIVAGYARRITGEASHRHHLALDRVAQLADANALLTKLHGLAQTLPASLDQAEVLDSTVARLRGLMPLDTIVILTTEPPGNLWTVARTLGVGHDEQVAASRLPAPAQRSIAMQRLIAVEAVTEVDRPFDSRSRCAVYTPLRSRDRLIGLLAIERRTTAPFTEREQRVLAGFVEPVALSIDNARWFRRLRTIGADEERSRIARDLHDRIGQSLAHLGFEIDRLIRRNDGTQPADTELRELRHSLREVVVEVRDALSDLRTDVGDHRDFASTAEDFAARVAERSGIDIDVSCDADRRLPLLQEREMWRIAQEALVNVERHAGASRAQIRWRCDARGALLEVSDDGCGLPPRRADGQLGRVDSFGLIGMRERADSIGATLELISQTGEGTKVRCFLVKR
ncbi:MAG: GAF domain-containing sensor histidine kinase [Actinomycetota bacterium]